MAFELSSSHVLMIVGGLLSLGYVLELLYIKPFFRTKAPWVGHSPEVWATFSLLGVIIVSVSGGPVALDLVIVLLVACISGQVLFNAFGHTLPRKMLRRGTVVRDVDGGYSFRVPSGFKPTLALYGSERVRIALVPSEGGITPYIAATIIGSVDYDEPPLEASALEVLARSHRAIGERVPAIETRYRGSHHIKAVRVSVIHNHFELLFTLNDDGRGGETAFESFLASVTLQ